MRVLVADDEAPARAKLVRWLGAEPDVELGGECADGFGAAQSIIDTAPDVVFLDVRMPGLTGLEIAAQLEPAHAPLVVFVTAFDAHALAAFDLDAVDYLLKPYDQERFRRALERVRERLGNARESAANGVAPRTAAVRAARRQTGVSERLLVPAGEGLRLIDSAGIHYLEADDNYVHVHTAEREYLLRRSLRDLVDQLGARRFVRIHKSAAVNLGEIETLAPLFKGDYELRLRSGKTLRLSRRYAAALFALTGR